MFIPADEYKRILSVLPILCVDCLIIHEQKCLLLKRTGEPAKGQYWFPGGRVFKGETIHDAALRKGREEVNLLCTFEQIISIEETIFKQQSTMETDIHTVNVCCKLSATETSNLNIDEYHDGYIWVSSEHAKGLDLHQAVLSPILKCLQPECYP